MSSPAIALPDRSSLLWFRHARTLLTGYGYPQAFTLIHDLRASVARSLAASAPPESAA